MDNHKTMVMLDALLDTRLGAVAVTNVSWASALIADPHYTNRRHNFLDRLVVELDDVAVTETYAKRGEIGAVLLPASPVTPIVTLIEDIVMGYLTDTNGPNAGKLVELTVNTHPFILEEETKDALQDSLVLATGATSCTFVSISTDNLTPSLLAQYDDIILTDLDGWLTCHIEAVKGKLMSKCTIYCPEIFVSREDNINEVPFSLTSDTIRLQLIEYFTVELMPLKFFSRVENTAK